MKKVCLLLLILFALANTAFALTTIEFNNGDSLAAWSTDRSAPGSFSIVDNELQMEVTGPYSSVGAFYDTQGMQMDIGQSNYLSVDMYIDSSWTNIERYAGLWAVGRDSDGNISSYPILEYQGGSGVVPWDSQGFWAAASNLFVLDGFNRFEFLISAAGIEYFLNSTLIYLDTVSDTDYFSQVILNGHYDGSDFTVRYDNLTYGVVPEPSTYLLMGIGLGSLALYRRRAKK